MYFFLSKFPLYFLKIPLHLLQSSTVFSPNTTIFAQDITALAQHIAVFGTIHFFMSNYLLWQREARAQRPNVRAHCGGRASSRILPQCQSRDCQVHLALHARLCLLGSLLFDIGLKLHLCTLQKSSPQPRLHLSYGELDCKVQLKSA